MEIIQLDVKQKKRAAQVVASAFFNYPMMTYYFPDPKKRARKLSWYMERVLNCALSYGEVLVTTELSGVMFTLPPGHTRLTQHEFIRNGFLPVPLVMGLHNYRNSDECEAFVTDLQEKLMNGRDHYYLWGLVADPRYQKSGAGTALLNRLTAKANSENLPVYLETHMEQNVAYYERFGFRLIEKTTIPVHNLELWCMVREPVRE